MSLEVQKKISLADYTTLKVGGVARYFAVVKNVDELLEAVKFSDSQKIPIRVLGSGSNVLIADGELPYLFLKNELKGVTYKVVSEDKILVKASAGEPWDSFVADTVEKNLSGLENLSGVPGTVGASPIQNINCYGASVSETIKTVEVLNTENKKFFELSGEECKFGYRDSIFKHEAGANLIVTAVTFGLSTNRNKNLSYQSSSQSIEKYLANQGIVEPAVADIRQAVLQVRKNIGMLEGQFRSAGSFFKNTIVEKEVFSRIEKIVNDRYEDLDKKFTPWHWSLPDGREKISTAFLLECSPFNKTTYGVKRWRDVAGLSPLHSLSIVTEVDAKAEDVRDFAKLITDAIMEIFGISLESEVNYIN